MRCLTLANALRDKGAEIIFICRDHPGHLFELIKTLSHVLLQLPPSGTLSEGYLAHAHFLGTTQEEDAQQTIEALKSIGRADWLIVDHYALDIAWETAMRRHVRRVMVIDDLADRNHDCEVLLDQNYYLRMEDRYEKYVAPHCKKLLGPQYALVRSEFKEARTHLKMRDGNVKRIFIFFGGSDATNETGKTLRAIQLVNKTDIAIDVVLGGANPHQSGISVLGAAMPQVRIFRQVNNMAELMANADLAIGAGGSTTWERCSLGLPTIAISVADNQVPIAEGVETAGAQIYLGLGEHITPEILAAKIAYILKRPQKLIFMSKAAMQLVDLNGCDRVCEVIKEAA